MAAMDHGAWLVIKLSCRLSIVFVIDIHVSLVLSWYIYVKFFYLKEAQQIQVSITKFIPKYLGLGLSC